MTIRYATTGGARLAVADHGAGAAMLFQHGLCGDARQPADVFPLDHFRCLTVECRGHGESQAGDPRQLSIATFANDIAGFLQRFDSMPLPVGGISMGAAVALRLAVTRPDLVSALVLARPAWVTDPAPDNMAPNAEVGELLARHTADAALAAFEQSDTARKLGQEAPANLASLRAFFSRAPLSTTAELLRRISADGPGVSAEQVRNIGVPTLVIGHAGDCIHPLATAEELAGLIPNARLSVIAAKADDPDRYRSEFRSVVREFLQEQTP